MEQEKFHIVKNTGGPAVSLTLKKKGHLATGREMDLNAVRENKSVTDRLNECVFF